MWQRRPSGLCAGELVRVRGERWRLVQVRRFAACEALQIQNFSTQAGSKTLLYPFDRPERLTRVERMKRVSTAAWLCRLVVVCREASQWNLLQTATDAHFDLLPYQLEPALAMLRGDALRVLLADEVGLGKTIQAGLLLRELAARGEGTRVLVITPAGLREQWRSELKDRFDLASQIVDATALRSLRRTMPRSTNPLSVAGIHILSVDFIKRPEVLQAADELVWDVVVIDEAHGLGPGTDRAIAGQALARRSRRVVLVSATPHQGDEDAFRALCTLGSAGNDDPLLIFRRTRRDVGTDVPRRTRVLPVRLSLAEARMHDLLAKYAAKVTEQANRGLVGQDALLAMMVLRKRSLSSAASLAASLERRLQWLDPAQAASLQLHLPLENDPSECSADDQAPDRVLAAAGLNDMTAERTWLRVVLEAARAASTRESKLAALTRALSRTNEPVIVFTEFRDTLARIAGTLRARAPYAVLHGGMRPAERGQAQRSFSAGQVRVLLATDAAAEGLNLQIRCRWVINLELPWNPVRLEQRIGRVDRVGQARRVHALHLVARGTGEEDLVNRLRLRLSYVRSAFGTAPSALPQRADEDVAPPRIAQPEGTTVPCADLKALAHREAERIASLRRLGWARMFAAAGVSSPHIDDLSGRVLRVDKWRRSTIGPFLYVFGACLTDGRGATVETCIVPVLARTGGSRPDALVRAVDEVRARCERIAEARRVLLQRLTARERAIAHARMGPVTDGLFQASLFDRREECAVRDSRARAQRMHEQLSFRVAMLESAARICSSDVVRLLLVRAPR